MELDIFLYTKFNIKVEIQFQKASELTPLERDLFLYTKFNIKIEIRFQKALESEASQEAEFTTRFLKKYRTTIIKDGRSKLPWANSAY